MMTLKAMQSFLAIARLSCLAQVQPEVGKLKKQLQVVRTKLLQSEQREADAHVRIESLQQDLAAVRADAQEAGGKVSTIRE